MFTEDITERKRMDTMKDEFISTVNHELRTPLTSIQGSLGLLKMIAAKDMNEKARKLLGLSYDNCERLTHLVNEILDIEKIASGKMTFHFELVEMTDLVNQVIGQNEGYADKYGVTYQLKKPEQPIWCEVDKIRFTQALTNLLSNAAKFSPENGIVTIDVSSIDNDQVKISVSDKGPGIPKSFQDKIFSKFAQADSSSTRKKGGTGLGLSITKSIIESFHGFVDFNTVEGAGSTFYFILPAVHPEETRRLS